MRYSDIIWSIQYASDTELAHLFELLVKELGISELQTLERFVHLEMNKRGLL